MTTIEVQRDRLFLGHTSIRPYTWLYRCVGPDGRRFDNRSIAELRAVLRRRYPGVKIVESWRA